MASAKIYGDSASAIIQTIIFFMAEKYFLRNLRSTLNNCKSSAPYAIAFPRAVQAMKKSRIFNAGFSLPGCAF